MSINPDKKIQILENRCKLLHESKIMYGIEVWRLSEAWKELDKVHCRFCEKLMGIPNCTSSELVEVELGGESRRRDCRAL